MFFLAYHSQKIALIRKGKKQITVEHLKTVDPNVKPLYIMNSHLKNKTYETVSGLESQEVLLRSLFLKLKSKREILSTLPFQVEHLIPFSQEETILLPTIYPGKEQTEVFLLASSKEALKTHLRALEEIEFDPDIVSCVPLALFRFARHFFPEYSDLLVHYQDREQNTFVVIKEGRLVASQSHKPKEFQRVSAYIQKKYPEINHLLKTGEASGDSPFISIDVKDAHLTEYAIPIGLALDASIEDTQKGQFRPKENPSKKQNLKRKKQITRFSLTCFAFIFTTLLMGHLHLKKEEQAILNSLGVSKNQRLYEIVSNLQRGLSDKKTVGIKPLTVPRVHEVLTWLSTHPKLDETCLITHLRYEMIKRPKIGSSSGTYGVKIDFECSIPSSKLAREFHDALLKDREMIDQKNRVQWSGDHGNYQVSFHLKSKVGG